MKRKFVKIFTQEDLIEIYIKNSLNKKSANYKRFKKIVH